MDSATPSEQTAIADPERMHCMEVWGGNRAVEKSFDGPGLRIWVFCRPYGNSSGGGDVYYISSCASGRISRILLADVSGHGSIAADLAVSLRDLMRRNVNMVNQTHFVRAMNEQFTDVAQHGGFATALVTTFFAPTRSLAVCNAGHPPPLLYRANQQAWTALSADIASNGKPTNMPLGVVESTDYVQFSTHLDQGDLLFSFSDALTESRDDSGRQLGTQGIQRIIEGLDVERPQQLIAQLLSAVDANRSDNLEQDDVTVLLAQATGTRTTWKDNLSAPFRLLRPVSDATQLD